MNLNENYTGKNVDSGSDSFGAFASLNRYFAFIETMTPTVEQAEQAIQLLCQVYGAKDEADLLQRGDDDLLACFNEMKAKILSYVSKE